MLSKTFEIFWNGQMTTFGLLDPRDLKMGYFFTKLPGHTEAVWSNDLREEKCFLKSQPIFCNKSVLKIYFK